ncbi:MAG TPA: ATP-binding protein [Solirubrobacteraceae bacterium]|nr:ATP-binding protein [Solirubrobacteraceae bacterium]
MGEFSAEADVQGGLHAGARARQLIHGKLAGRLTADALADVNLLLTELVANTVWHGGADEASTLHVRIAADDSGVRVEVENPRGASGDPAQRVPDLDGGGGLGLHIVERVADRWGVRREPRVAVWFELDREHSRLA